MGAKDISYTSLLFLLVLVIPIFYLNIQFKLKLNKRIVLSVIRMAIQLSLVGLYLQYIFKWNNPLVNTLYLLLMISLASFSVVKSVGLPYKKLLLPVIMAILIPTFLLVLYFNVVIIQADTVLEARYVITIGGMLLGNMLNGVIVGLNSFYKGISDQEKTYLYRVALGASRAQAIAPYYRDAIFATINPTLASIATIGLVSLPGMMTGQILGGSVPLVAIKYQIAIMIAIFIVKYAAIVLSLTFSMNSFFDGYGRLQVDRTVKEN